MNTRYAYKKINYNDTESLNLAYIAGISSIGMAYKMSIAPIDIADALIVEQEAIKSKLNYYNYFNKFTPKMLMNISISAIKISRNLDKYKNGIIKFTVC